jgi:DNA transformation protein and related proteins
VVANSPEFVNHALDLVSLVGAVQARAMFGGHGLYCRGVMFGLLDDDELFLKSDEECRPSFDAAACRRWVYASRNGPMETDYFRPPDEAHEDPEAMLTWARLALGAALRKAAAKAAKEGRPRSRAGAAAKAAKEPRPRARKAKPGANAAKEPRPPVRKPKQGPGRVGLRARKAPARRRAARGKTR